jgi:putative endonuclease
MSQEQHYVYVLRSLKDGRLYTGYTTNLKNRLEDHNAGHTKSTRNRRPLELVYSEKFESKKDAMEREKFFKTPQGGVAKRRLISEHYIDP